jgi:iron complex outermembrane recepter protein
MTRHTRALLSASTLVLALTGQIAFAADAPAAAADPAAPAADATATDIIVTGTRTTGTRAADSAAPIQIVGPTSFQSVGQQDLTQVLAQSLPSLNFQAFGGDTANLTLSAALRGLSPNDTLVLVNGKRRHFTANLAVDSGSPYSGSATTDFSFIPTASIGRIEVLQDGAAAQYGSDAIAGVINIILKDADHGGTWDVTGGQYYQGDGKTAATGLNLGFKLGQRGFINLTGEYKFHDFSQRGGADYRYAASPSASIATGGTGDSDWPNVNHIVGDARYTLYNIDFNAGYHLTDDIEAYGFGGYGNRTAYSYENYRSGTKISATNSNGVTVYPLPNGFNPLEGLREEDFQFTAGLKGAVSGWNWDLSQSYGRDADSLSTLNSANQQFYADVQSQSATIVTPQRNFYVGSLINSEWASDLDVTRDFDLGLAKPVTLAFGGQYRYDRYEVDAGEPNSYLGSGASSNPGIQPVDAGVNGRKAYAAYIDLAIQPTDPFKIDLAGRYEHYSEFGSVWTGKATARYDLSPAFALRGTVSNGFRAPTLAEEYYTSVNVSPTTVSGQIQADSATAQALGFDKLKPEKSTNYSLGFVAHPTPRLQITADAYDIELRNRVVGTSVVAESGGVVYSQAALNALNALGVTGQGGVTTESVDLYTNGANTRTRGVEATASYATDFGSAGKIDWTLGFNYNTTKATALPNLPGIVQNANEGQVQLLTRNALSALTTATPKVKAILNALYSQGRFSLNLRETFYGTASEWVSQNGTGNASDPSATLERTGFAAITDLDIGYKLTHSIRFDMGANNLFDKKAPSRPLYQGTPADGSVVLNAPIGFTPWGIDGGYYYIKATWTF